LTLSSGLQAAPSTVGVSGSQSQRSPGLSGILSIAREVRSGRRKTESDRQGARSDWRITFDFGEHEGSFRGKPAGDEIDGFWIQPATGVNGGAFASPLRLKSTGEGRVVGDHVPLPSRLTFYLPFQRQRGKLSAIVKNPELALAAPRARRASGRRIRLARLGKTDRW